MNQNHPIPVNIGQIYKMDSIYQMPLYQRAYCWKTNKELKAYKRDLERIFDVSTADSHEEVFLGAIILQETKTSSRVTTPRYVVIDGQQRLTTIYLTLAALSSYAYEKGWVSDAASIIRNYMVSRGSGTEDKPLLEPTNLDTNQFYAILRSLQAHDISTSIGQGKENGDLTSAYKYIQENIVREIIRDVDAEESKNTFDSFLECFLGNFVIADVTLSEKHNPNEVFDRLNTKGIKLGIIDLIRNNLFKPYSDIKDSESFYNNKWLPFEKRLKTKHSDTKNIDKQVDNFFFPYAINKKHTISKRSLVSELNDFWKKTKSEDIIDDMAEYINPYFAIMSGKKFIERIPKNYSDNLKQVLKNIHELAIPQASYPFFMRCLLEYEKGDLSEKDLIECFNMIESFLVRRAFVFQEEGTGYNAIFKRLWVETGGKPKEVRKKMPTRTKQFPSDEEFKNSISKIPLYNMRIDKYCLLQYEKFLMKNKKESLNFNVVETIDHISPRNPKKLDKKEQEKYEKTLNLWGNLLPMSKPLNSSKSNRNINSIWDEISKQVRTETSIEWFESYSKEDLWVPSLILKRSKKIADWAVKRWPNFD